MRTPFVAANWKMHKTRSEAESFARELAGLLEPAAVEVAIAPAFTALGALGAALRSNGVADRVALAAQNVNAESHGAFTGEVSADMLVELGCGYVIIGHSERRALFGESSEDVSRKLVALQAAQLRAIVCVGETLEDREAGRTFDVVGAQLAASLAGHDPAHAADLVIAYEPVWAIGTGRTATPEGAQQVHAWIRTRLEALTGAAVAHIRILYGGSVKPDNARELMAQPDIDGALVGGASLDPAPFSAIIHASSGD